MKAYILSQSARRVVRGFGIGLGALALGLNFAACNSTAGERAISPLIGSWHINGDTPKPDANYPQFTSLAFRRDGTVDAEYVAASGALAGVVKMNAKKGTEHDTYTLVGEKTVRIVEGSRSLDYTYDVRDGKLYLRSANAETAAVFSKVTDSSEEHDSVD